MSESDKKPSRDIGYLDFNEYANKKKIQPSCPICAKQSWSFISETGGRNYVLPNFERENNDLLKMSMASIVLLNCRHCGYIAPILRATVCEALGIADEQHN